MTVAILHGEAYGIAIVNEMEERLSRRISIGALQIVLRRLEKKGHLVSEFGEATKVRGGKRKRYFTVTNFGKQTLKETKDQRLSLLISYRGVCRTAPVKPVMLNRRGSPIVIYHPQSNSTLC